jgi:hypothetical protein
MIGGRTGPSRHLAASTAHGRTSGEGEHPLTASPFHADQKVSRARTRKYLGVW